MLFELKHQTTFEYSSPVTESLMEFRLTPVTDSCQRVLQHRSHVTPLRQIQQHLDYLGNTVSTFNIQAPHDRVQVCFESLVETFAGSRRTGELRGLARFDSLQPSSRTKWTPAFLDYAQRFASLRGAENRQAAEEIRSAIFEGFRYDTAATHSGSTINDLLEGGAGVCQDFSHLMIALCRWLAIPARYVSGYVLTESASEGAVASHAWVEVYDPVSGWVGIDPTHNKWVEEHHIRIGVGRDYDDVAPNKGVYRGSAEELVSVAVHLRPITPDELEQSSQRLFTASQLQNHSTRQTRRPPQASLLQQVSAAQQ